MRTYFSQRNLIEISSTPTQKSHRKCCRHFNSRASRALRCHCNVSHLNSPAEKRNNGKKIIMGNSHLAVAISPQQYVHWKWKCDEIYCQIALGDYGYPAKSTIDKFNTKHHGLIKAKGTHLYYHKGCSIIQMRGTRNIWLS